MKNVEVALFWFRRDLRLIDNIGLIAAFKSNYPVLPIFIFDEDIIDELPKDDARISFIYENLEQIDSNLKSLGSSLIVKKGKIDNVWKELCSEFNIKAVFANEDYEPYAIQRDLKIDNYLASKNISFNLLKDQVIFAKGEVVKQDQTPYTVYTPYKNKWREHFATLNLTVEEELSNLNFAELKNDFPPLEEIGFIKSNIKVKPFKIDNIANYSEIRNYPAVDGTSYLSPHLRFGTVSVRELALKFLSNTVLLDELIWREFFMQILYHFPKVVNGNFREKYDFIEWRNDLSDFEKWKNGQTGYPMVDAGMRQLNETGYMHNRVRMITAGFLCKHLLIDWRWGEAYFAEKLLDYDLSANNGNWQWSAGTGCDAAPYFRVFNPTEQIKKYDPELKYIRKWVPEIDELTYPLPMVEHKFARERALKVYKEGIREV